MIGNNITRKQKVVESIFRRSKKELGRGKVQFSELTNFLEKAKNKLDSAPTLTDRELFKLKSFDISKLSGNQGGGFVSSALGLLGSVGLGMVGENLAKKFFGKKLAQKGAETVAKKVTKEVAQEGAETAGKLVSKEALEAGGKVLAKEGTEKAATKGIGKLLGKKIPVVGAALGGIFAVERAMKGDLLGAAGELASGVASTVPGFGTAASLAIDGALLARDVKKASDNADKTSSDTTTTKEGLEVVQPQTSMMDMPKFRKAVDDFGKIEIDFASRTFGGGDPAATGQARPVSTVMEGTPEAPVAPGGGLKSLADAAESLKGMNSNRKETDWGRNGCVWSVNQVYKAAGLTPPWGTSLWVPTAEKKMIDAGYVEIPRDQRQPGDIMINYNTRYAGDPEPQAHIGVVINNGNVLSNSSSRASFSTELSPEGYDNIYGGERGKIYRAPSTVTNKGTTTTTQKPPAVNGTSAAANTKQVATIQTQPKPGDIRKTTRKVQLRGAKTKNETVYQRYDEKHGWQTATGKTAAELEKLIKQQEYERSQQGRANLTSPPVNRGVPDSVVMSRKTPVEAESQMVSTYTAYNNPTNMVNSTTLINISTGGSGFKPPMVVQMGGGQTATIVPPSDSAVALKLAKAVLYNKLVS